MKKSCNSFSPFKAPFLAVALGAVLLLALGACRSAFFAGISNKASNQLDLTFTSLNTTEFQMFKVYAGDELEGEVNRESGALSIQIKAVDGDILYENKNADSGNFTVEIPESGSYWVSVAGREAKGKVRIVVAEKEKP